MRALRLALMLAAVLAGPTARAADPARVVATVGMVADVARIVAGPCAATQALMAPGIDPHLYKASAGDVATLAQADAILTVGLNLEGQLGDVLARLARSRLVVAVGEAAVPEAERLTAGDYADPHVWMDGALWARTAPVIAQALGAIVPDCAADMAARAEAYRTELLALDAWVRASVATIPAERRLLVTAHDAFAYYGRAYGIEVRGIQGVSTDSEAGIADIRAVVDTVVADRVPAIFVESTINPRTVEAVIAAAADRGHALALGGSLHADALGAPDTPGGTYAGMLYENTRTIVTALGGTPVPLPAALHAWARGLDLPITE